MSYIQLFVSLNWLLTCSSVMQFIFVLKLIVDMFQFHTVHIYISLPRLVTCSGLIRFIILICHTRRRNYMAFLYTLYKVDTYISICTGSTHDGLRSKLLILYTWQQIWSDGINCKLVVIWVQILTSGVMVFRSYSWPWFSLISSLLNKT